MKTSKALLVLILLFFVGCGNSFDDDFVRTGTTPVPTALVFQTVPQRTAGQSFAPIQVAIVDNNGTIVPGADNPVTLALSEPGSATLSGTLTQNAENGVATFNDVSANLVGSYTFLANSPGLTGAESQTFQITVGAAAQLVFTQQPTDTNRGEPFDPLVTVEVRDSSGNLLPDFTGSVVLSLSSDPSGTATLGGESEADFVNGVASFDDLRVNFGAGSEFSLTAMTDEGLAEVSNSFDVASPNRLYVADRVTDEISVFDISASGSATPLRVISGSNTQLGGPRRLAVSQGELFVTNIDTNELLVFPLSADGDVIPTRRISGGNTGLMFPHSVAVVGDEIFVTDSSAQAIFVFPRSGDGDISPTRTIQGGNTGLTEPVGIAIDEDEIFVGDGTGAAVSVFNLDDEGDVAPQRTIAGPAADLARPLSLTIFGDEILVSNSGKDEVRVFDRNATGDATPLRVIGGGNTGLGGLVEQTGVAGGLLFVTNTTNTGTDRISVFNLSDDGDVFPQRTITGFAQPLGLVVGFE